MARPVVTKEDLKLAFEDAFNHIGVSKEDQAKFFEDGCILEDIPLCDSVLIEVDDYITGELPNYAGCRSRETFEEIWEYNESYLN